MQDRDGIFAGDEPIEIFRRWLGEAERSEVNDPNAATLATVDASGMPNARVILIKGIEPSGLYFYTNYESAKGGELVASGKAALCLHWKSLRRQVRFRGNVSKASAENSDAYYNTRGLESRIGAWASLQSRPLPQREILEEAVAERTASLGSSPPRPEHWGGFHLRPDSVEFWSDGAARLHDRFVFTRRAGDEWSSTRLYP